MMRPAAIRSTGSSSSMASTPASAQKARRLSATRSGDVAKVAVMVGDGVLGRFILDRQRVSFE
jgi:hypothetical protein